MSSQDCRVCTIQSTCPAEEFVLYAPTAPLTRRVADLLAAAQVPHQQDRQNFRVRCSDNREALIDRLAAQMPAEDADALRVSFDLANLMGAMTLSQTVQRAKTRWFEEALIRKEFAHWYQPIVDARQQLVVGHECLIRLEKSDEPGRFYNGDEIVRAAATRGDLHVFDSQSRQIAITNAARCGLQGRVFINFTPSSIYDPAFCMASTLQAMQGTAFQPADIVFEVVESDHIADVKHLRKIVDYYRQKGFSVALDDVGTGSNMLPMVREICPDYLKIDKSIVWNYQEPAGLDAVRKIVEIAGAMGATVIAEGIETPEMRDAMLSSGVTWMQGYYFGRPQPRPSPHSDLCHPREL